jgi:Zn-dependent protease
VTLIRVRGVPIRLHFTFLIVASLLIFFSLDKGVGAIISGVLVGVILFGSVILHELGHVIAAKRCGIGTRDITIYPFGGIARIERDPETPRDEIAISLAGPAINLVLFIVCLPFALSGSYWATLSCNINIIMGVFNLVPAYPMDGGRVLRALLSKRLDRYSATLISLRVSRVLAIIFIAAAFAMSWLGLLIVGIFLMYITGTEKRRINKIRDKRENIA